MTTVSQRRRQIKEYLKRKARGICPKCNKRKPEENRIICRICIEKNKESHKKKYDNYLIRKRRFR